MRARPPGIVVCASRGYFADDVAATCARCGTRIVHRPHVPAAYLKVCLPCARTDLASQRAHITPETLADLRLYYARPKGSA